MNTIEKIRGGILTTTTNDPCSQDYIAYRTVFLGKNLFVYRVVKAGDKYRGENHTEDGLVLAWADYTENPQERPPAFVKLRE